MHTARMPGATGASLALLLGVVAVQWLPTLPPRWSVLALAFVALIVFVRYPRARWFALVAFGIGWAIWRGGMALDLRLPRAFEGRDFIVIGQVIDLPLARTEATRFALRVEQASLDGLPVTLHGQLNLNWYQGAPGIPACSRWRLKLRLKRPRGMLNPGGADSERMALERHIAATGYVRDDSANRQLGTAALCLDGLRAAIAQGIAAQVHDPHDAALLQAFSVGDIRGLSQYDWEVARANGISHLIAISGFHVGVAAIFGVALARLLYWLWPTLALRRPRINAQAAAALCVAGMYTALAGFGLPTVRTLLMIAVVALARCSRRGMSGAQSLALALIAIVLVDPLSVLAAGFWLSFIGVGFLMLCLDTRSHGWRGFVHELSAGQLVMTVSLLPLTMWFFGEASLVGALSNLVAVPFVSFVIVPCALLGMILLPVPWLAGYVLRMDAVMAHAQWWLLERMAHWPGAHWYLPEVQPWALLLATLGAVWLFAPRGLPLRSFGLLLFLPLLWPPRTPLAEGAFQAYVLDVGQGLSVVVRTEHHTMVYDTGARYPSGFDLGEAAVLPSLHALGVGDLDVLMISHADNDHAGGAAAIAAAYPHARRLAGEPARMPVPMQLCVAGQGWQWDGVRFRVLFPAQGTSNGNGKANDHSCVVLVEGRGGRLLLTGDISSKVEDQVLAALPVGGPIVLLVPHHGSRSSSSAAFITALQPRLALVSAGWHNRFGHPHPLVVARFAAASVPLFNTADRGAIQLDAPVNAAPRVSANWRQRAARYWRE